MVSLIVAAAALSVVWAGQATRHPKHRRHAAVKTAPMPPAHAAALTQSLIQVDITPGHALNKFTPSLTLGASIDAVGIGGTASNMSASNVAKMVSSGAGSLSYRLYTELNVQDWHWNPTGTWSDKSNHQGYFVGSSTPSASITDSYGFLLTHRGDTFDQGDNQDFSRLTDGDGTTYWKSNPYLTNAYTHEADSLHPQWVLIDLGSSQSVNAIQISWANPYAFAYNIQYWTGSDALYDPTNGSWANFPNGVVLTGKGGKVTLQLSSGAISAEFIRVVMTQSSGTYDTHGTSDPRNKMGYAINEIGVGTLSGGTFHDLVTHSADQNQTAVYVSSTDPWHESTSQNQGTEQIGLDAVYGSPLSQSLPMTVPVAMVYSTPENAVAEIAYLTARHDSILGVELGEEPDGQFMTPEDYGAYYVQWAAAIHASYPSVKVGGPVLSSSVVSTWPNASGETDWMKRFVAYLNSHNALSQLQFVSCEHYPFTANTTDWALLSQEPGLVQSYFSSIHTALVPKTVPVYITEYNFSAGATEVTVDLMGALWQAVFVGEFLNNGGQGAFFYQLFPWPLDTDGSIWGMLGMFTADANDQSTGSTSQYLSNLMMCDRWCVPGGGTHSVLPTTSSITNGSGQKVVFSYALARPDGRYSVMLVNGDSVSHRVQIQFLNRSRHAFSGIGSRFVVDSNNYVWHPNGANGYAKPNGPIAASMLFNNASSIYVLPPHSLTVLVGRVF